MHLVIWILAGLALASWSLLAWGLASLLGVDPAWVNDLKPWLDRVPYRSLLDVWLPGWQAALEAAIDVSHSLFDGLGAVAPWIVGLVWGAGALVIVSTAGLLSGIVALARRQTARQATQQTARQDVPPPAATA